MRRQAANAFGTSWTAGRRPGRCRSSTVFIELAVSQSMPGWVYTSAVKWSVKNRSLLSRREAISTKMRKAVSLKTKPRGRVSAYIPTSRSTFSMSPS